MISVVQRMPEMVPFEKVEIQKREVKLEEGVKE